MNILEQAKKLVCDMNPAEAKRLNMLDGRSVQTWPEWAKRDFKLACDAMVAVNAPKVMPTTDIPAASSEACRIVDNLKNGNPFPYA